MLNFPLTMWFAYTHLLPPFVHSQHTVVRQPTRFSYALPERVANFNSGDIEHFSVRTSKFHSQLEH